MNARIEVHPILVRGQKYTVQLDEDGTFHACNDAGIEAATSETRRGLLDTLTKLTRQAAATVNVPVTRLKDGKAQHGRCGNRHPRHHPQPPYPLGRRETGTAEHAPGRGNPRRHERGGRGRLVEAQNAAGRAIYAFRQAHEIDLYAAVRAQIAGQLGLGSEANQ